MNMSAAKKWKIDEWYTKFIVVPHNNGVFCLICQITIAVMKEFLPLRRKIQNWWQKWVLSFVNVWQKKENLLVMENLLKIVW